ncbi:MAG: amino acid dehydrogenase [Polyangiaceae bacterium]|jgi:glutamate dehydrogenase/leucine dehydrogenase|nr:amino acid dehydrogenase [Polyangiaceae bacterium]
MKSTADLRPQALIDTLRDAKQQRAYLVWDSNARVLRASHPVLDGLAREVQADTRDFHEHEGVFLQIGPETGTLLGAFIHRTVRGQAAGGVRHWPYATVRDFLRDGLRLARGMGRKCALAGLWWGGGKGVIARQEGRDYRDPAYRQALYREYGAFITSLRGCYVTAEDAGTVASDMAEIFRTTRFVTCIPPELGGSGNPSFATAKGVLCAMQGALDALGMGTLAGKSVAMQGAGNVGAAMIQDLLDHGVTRVVATDIAEPHVVAARDRFAGKPVDVRIVAPSDVSIFETPCDLFAPNALGGVLNPDTIPLLNARIVCGAANNQLLDEQRDDRALAERGITYVPDFVCNRMGIVNCANEQYGVLPDDPAVLRHFGRDWDNALFVVTRAVLARAAASRTTTSQAANCLADELSAQPHPIWGHRGRAIMDALVAERWQDKQ